jgi:hypothetical protein
MQTRRNLSGESVGMLLPAYKRKQHLKQILDISFQGGIQDFFIFCDGPVQSNSEKKYCFQEDIIDVVRRWQANNPRATIHWAIAKRNFGCSASILRGLDWISKHVSKFIVMEDDCLPSPDFFDYSVDAFNILEKQSDPWLFCGSQFAPPDVTGRKWCLSRYSLTWGWGTTSEKWKEIRGMLLETDIKNISVDSYSSLYERLYWKAGRRRAIQGFIDVWDILISDAILRNSRYAILPGVNLVSNYGTDSYATHTVSIHPFNKWPFGEYLKSKDLDVNLEVDNWLRERFYGISSRHLVTTNLTYVLDLLIQGRRKVKPLASRWLSDTDYIEYS